MLPNRLPRPDALGNYWLGETHMGAAVFASGRPEAQGKFFATHGKDTEGVLLVPGGIRYFDTPEEALAALNQGRR